MVFLQAASTKRYRLATRPCKFWFCNLARVGRPFGQGLSLDLLLNIILRPECWSGRVSNPQPPAPENDALPLSNPSHISTTYGPHTNHIPTTYQPHTNHIPTTYQPHMGHIPTTYQPHTNHIPTTYQPHTDHIRTTYRPDQLVHYNHVYTPVHNGWLCRTGNQKVQLGIVV